MEIATIPVTCSFSNYKAASAVGSLVTPILSTFLFLMNIALLVFDIILFTRENGCNPKNYFISDDPYYFRIEFIINSVVIFLLGIVNLYHLAFYVANAKTDPSNISVGLSTFGWNFVSEIILIFCLSCFGIIFATLNFMIKKLKPKTYESDFDAFINTKKGKEIFKKFSKREWSLENILFYEDVQKYENITNIKYAKRRSLEIYQNFIEVGSPLEVNLSGPIRKNLKHKINNFDEFKEYYASFFVDAVKETKRNMRDTFSRIITSLEFSKWRESSKNLIETAPETPTLKVIQQEQTQE
jgi:hypothetical protein